MSCSGVTGGAPAGTSAALSISGRLAAARPIRREVALRMNLIPQLHPNIRVLRESGSLDSYDAEALSSWRLHHDPTLQAIDNLRAQRLKARDLGGNVVALNIDVYATFMIHTLDLHNGFVGRSLQHVVIFAS